MKLEPKEYWFIDYDGGIIPFNRRKETATDRLMKSIGNYFESEEEAEKVVALLKRIAIIKSYGCNVYKYINTTVLSIEDYYERNKDDVWQK